MGSLQVAARSSRGGPAAANREVVADANADTRPVQARRRDTRSKGTLDIGQALRSAGQMRFKPITACCQRLLLARSRQGPRDGQLQLLTHNGQMDVAEPVETLEVLSQRHGCSRQRVGQIEGRASEKVEAALRRDRRLGPLPPRQRRAKDNALIAVWGFRKDLGRGRRLLNVDAVGARVRIGSLRDASHCGMAERWKCTIFHSSPRFAMTNETRPGLAKVFPS